MLRSSYDAKHQKRYSSKRSTITARERIHKDRREPHTCVLGDRCGQPHHQEGHHRFSSELPHCGRVEIASRNVSSAHEWG